MLIGRHVIPVMRSLLTSSPPCASRREPKQLLVARQAKLGAIRGILLRRLAEKPHGHCTHAHRSRGFFMAIFTARQGKPRF